MTVGEGAMKCSSINCLSDADVDVKSWNMSVGRCLVGNVGVGASLSLLLGEGGGGSITGV